MQSAKVVLILCSCFFAYGVSTVHGKRDVLAYHTHIDLLV